MRTFETDSRDERIDAQLYDEWMRRYQERKVAEQKQKQPEDYIREWDRQTAAEDLAAQKENP